MVTGSPAGAAVERPEPASQRIDVWVAPNTRQRRWTVLLRAVLVLPHLVVLYALGIAAGVITVIGWFGALFSGRLPDFAADFLGGVLRWQARVWAYGWLLTDRYPPFTLDQAPDYAVRIAIRRGPLNRLSVLFRLFLAIPLMVVAVLVEAGAAVLHVVAWLVTLVVGRLPGPFHEGFRSVVRLQVRFNGYWRMLSSEYGWWNLFGDLPEAGQPPGAPPGAPLPPPPGVVPGTPPPPPPDVAPGVPPDVPAAAPPPPPPPTYPTVPTVPVTPTTGEVSREAPRWAEPASVSERGAVGSAAARAPGDGWRLIMGAGGRAVVIISILLGIVLAVGYSTALAVLAANSSTATTARQQTATAEQQLVQGIRTANVNLTVCHSLLCARRQSAAVARDLRQFGAAVSRIDYPGPAGPDVSALQGSIHEAAGAFGLLAVSPSRAAFDRRLLPAREKLSVVFNEYQLLDQQLHALE